MNKNQKELTVRVLDFLSSTRTVFNIQGDPGTGKTYWLCSFISQYENMMTFKVATPTNAAANVINKKFKDFGVNQQAITVAKLCGQKPTFDFEEIYFQINTDDDLSAGENDVIIIDESSMVSKLMFQYIIKMNKTNRKVILIGDNNQLNPVKGEPLNIKVDYFLSEQMRNADFLNEKSLLKKLMPFVHNEALYANDKKLKNIIDSIEKVDIVDALMENEFDPKYDRIIVYRNEVKEAINKIYKERILGVSGSYGEYTAKDVIIFNQPFGKHYNGQICTVLSAKAIYFDIKNSKLPYCQEFNCEFIVYKLLLDSKETVSVIAEQSKEDFQKIINTIGERCHNKEIPWFIYHKYKQYFADISLAYSITSHKSQGQTIRNAFIVIDDIKHFEISALYVALSRGANKNICVSL